MGALSSVCVLLAACGGGGASTQSFPNPPPPRISGNAPPDNAQMQPLPSDTTHTNPQNVAGAGSGGACNDLYCEDKGGLDPHRSEHRTGEVAHDGKP